MLLLELFLSSSILTQYSRFGHIDLTLNFHPVAIRASAEVTPVGAM